ncbi:type I phosphomannose isomerase catalytic subunit [Planctomycetes bacterium K23_9]|uniref:Mannose-6-phosphate isomerase YvyI n=1 Tax=Stieleria marina TaxID=1930275 RepID=A0A517NZL4_9BACT|nr:Putative mannose-6-phosphate isomerase YvyI [Planctomycetes bacterium K23_9]
MNPTPLRFRPVIKQTIWGGRRLGETLGKPIGDQGDYAESWEVVDHGADQSIVVGGDAAGKSLQQLVHQHADWLLGKHRADSTGQFPLLLKYLDCNRVLSVQVHPDDQYGAQMPVPDRGKTEAWYIVASEPDSLIYAGLKSGVDRDALSKAVADGQTEKVLHSFHPAAGDVVFIPAGTVHALGAGLLVAEIQQSSNTTFRLFDWNRVGADGNPRELHVQQSLEVSDYQSGPVAARSSDQSAAGWQELVRCDKFVLQALENGAATISGDDQFHILTVPSGTARVGDTQLSAGDSVLLPAAMQQTDVSVDPDSTLLAMHLP